MEEYSVIKPATNSDSASGKSKGTLFDSAKIAINNKIKKRWLPKPNSSVAVKFLAVIILSTSNQLLIPNILQHTLNSDKILSICLNSCLSIDF